MKPARPELRCIKRHAHQRRRRAHRPEQTRPMHRRRAAQRQRITRINDDIDQRQTVARRNAVLAQRQRLAPAHQPQHADKRQRHPQPLQRMRPPAQKTYIHQQHRERNQRGNHRHIDHTRATGKSAIQHHIEQRKTAAPTTNSHPARAFNCGQSARIWRRNSSESSAVANS